MKIGLEVHVALPTKSKLFCGCSTTADEPNSSICEICMGFPGSKPMLNKSALMYALEVANALHCKTNKQTSFVRKVYFYPDLPKSYQITQLNDAVGFEGHLELENKTVGIRRIQLEEDPAKVVREDGYTLIDFNRSGTPLLEIVTEPDIQSEEELREFINELKSILYYLGVDIEKELKVDLNVSIGSQRVEVKNVTGLRNLVDAARYEIKRQEELVKKKQVIVAETRSYNESTLKTESSREKESDEEYGFIFEPDLTIYQTDMKLEKKPIYAGSISRELARKYKSKAKTILELIQFDRQALDLIEDSKGKYEMQKIIGTIEALKKYGSMDIGTENFAKLMELAKGGTQITEPIIQQVKKGVAVEISNVSVEKIDAEIKSILKSRAELLKEFEKNPKSLNFLVGEVSKKLKANPREVAERLRLVLEKEYKS